ncbi:TPA: hypothetical protein DCY67_05805 [Candidatus Acetothermia bacterium]|nr:hypothetical protein [Candidatus Acetothermia bacterium]
MIARAQRTANRWNRVPPHGVYWLEVDEMRKWLSAILILSGFALGFAQSGPSPLGLVPTPVPGLSAAIWVERPHYTVGETARVHFHISRAAFVYVFSIDASGLVRLIFPNPFSPHAFRPAGTHVLPDQPTYQFRVVRPVGTAALQLVASTCPLPVPGGTLADPYPLLGPDPWSGRAAVLGLVPEPSCGWWVTAWTTFQIVEIVHMGFWPCPPCWGVGPCPPCLGFGFVTPSAGWFLDSTGNWRSFVGECPSGPGWCWFLGPDGRWRFSIQICFGNCP